MILTAVITLMSTLPMHLALKYDGSTAIRNRRISQRKNSPFIIRVPYSNVSPVNPLFAHSVVWKANRPPSTNVELRNEQNEQNTDLQVTQFHSQDANSRVVFGFNSPDQMRIETRDADGTVHGTYRYLDPYGQIIERQYWDTGSGFHVTDNVYPTSDQYFSNRVLSQAARDSHFHSYQQALNSLLPPNQGVRGDRDKNNNATTNVDNLSLLSLKNDSHNLTGSLLSQQAQSMSYTSTSNDRKPDRPNLNTNKSKFDNGHEDDADAVVNTTTILKTNDENGSIVIQNPEYLKISWSTENKNLRNDTDRNQRLKFDFRRSRPMIVNATKFTIQGSSK